MATPVTAARDTANYSRFYLSTLEEMDHDPSEIVYEENILLWILNRLRQRRIDGGRDFVKPLSSVKNDTFQAFSGTDQLKTSAQEGPSAALYKMKNFKVSIMGNWEEDIENSGSHQNIDLFMEKVENSELAMAEGLNDAALQGQGADSKNFEGLEEAIFAGDQTAGSAETITRDQVFSGSNSNTYAGIARGAAALPSASTVTDAEAGWRNASADWSGLGQPKFTSGTTPILDSDSYQALSRMYNLLTRGANGPDLIMMTLQPYEDFSRLGENQVRFEKTGGMEGGMNFPFETLKYGKAMVVKYEGGQYSGLNGADATAAADMVYFLNTKFWEVVTEQKADFAWTDFYGQPDQLGGIAHMIHRMTLACTNPRWQGVGHGYGA